MIEHSLHKETSMNVHHVRSAKVPQQALTHINQWTALFGSEKVVEIWRQSFIEEFAVQLQDRLILRCFCLQIKYRSGGKDISHKFIFPPVEPYANITVLIGGCQVIFRKLAIYV